MRITGKMLFGLGALILVLQIASLAALISPAVPMWAAVTLKVGLFAAIATFFGLSWRMVRRRLREA